MKTVGELSHRTQTVESAVFQTLQLKKKKGTNNKKKTKKLFRSHLNAHQNLKRTGQVLSLCSAETNICQYAHKHVNLGIIISTKSFSSGFISKIVFLCSHIHHFSFPYRLLCRFEKETMSLTYKLEILSIRRTRDLFRGSPDHVTCTGALWILKQNSECVIKGHLEPFSFLLHCKCTTSGAMRSGALQYLKSSAFTLPPHRWKIVRHRHHHQAA